MILSILRHELQCDQNKKIKNKKNNNKKIL